jgi:hypothetical protein
MKFSKFQLNITKFFKILTYKQSINEYLHFMNLVNGVLILYSLKSHA